MRRDGGGFRRERNKFRVGLKSVIGGGRSRGVQVVLYFWRAKFIRRVVEIYYYVRSASRIKTLSLLSQSNEVDNN